MKNIITGLQLLLFIILFSNCKKDDNKADIIIEEEVSFLSFKVNNVLYLSTDNTADSSITNQGKKQTLIISKNSTNEKLVIRFGARGLGTFFFNQIVGSEKPTIALYFKNDSTFQALNGSIKVTKYDIFKKTLSATFSFNSNYQFSGLPASKFITEGEIKNIKLGN